VKQTYLVEIKHWLSGKPGPKQVQKFINVTASRQVTGGLFLSSSGYASTVYSGLAMVAPVRLGDGSKITSLCKTYYRIGSPMWLNDDGLEEELFSGTFSP